MASLGATVSVSTSVQSGQGYYIKVLAAGGPGPIGGYGLLVNFGSPTNASISPLTPWSLSNRTGRRHIQRQCADVAFGRYFLGDRHADRFDRRYTLGAGARLERCHLRDDSSQRHGQCARGCDHLTGRVDGYEQGTGVAQLLDWLAPAPAPRAGQGPRPRFCRRSMKRSTKAAACSATFFKAPGRPGRTIRFVIMPARDRITELRFQQGHAEALKAGWSRWDLERLSSDAQRTLSAAGGF